MNKSLEALERLGAERLARGELIRNDSKVEAYIQTIKQDLERLEQLEKENIEFANEISYLKEELESGEDLYKMVLGKKQILESQNQELRELVDCLQTDYDTKDFECIDLEKENQELKEQNNLIMEAIESDVSNGELFKSICNILQIQNEKLKKAIEILKKYLFLADEKCLVWQKGYEHSTEVSDTDYVLLCEVLADETNPN